MNKIALCCIAKTEEQYIDEWIEYNIKLGFDHIYVYENDWNYPINNPKVTIIPYPGKIQQLAAYNHCLRTYKNRYNYIAFFDCDEFLVLKKHAIGINWQFYGANGCVSRNTLYPKSLLKQFLHRQKGVNRHVKVIVNTKSNANFYQNPHCVNVSAIDTNGKIFLGPFNDNGPVNVAV